MGLWSRIKKAVKKIVRFVKAVVRVVFRVVVTVITAIINIVDIINTIIWLPPKELRLHILILSDGDHPVVGVDELTPSIEYARRVLNDRLNVKLFSYDENMVDIITEPAPDKALNVCCDACAFKEEFVEAGEFFAKHMTGSDPNGISLSLKFPITVFVVKTISGKVGCSLGPLTDYITLGVDGVRDNPASTMMHEIGHACNRLFHTGTVISDLMYGSSRESGNIRGDRVKLWEKCVIRASRHVRYS